MNAMSALGFRFWLRDGETTIKIEFVLLRGGGAFGAEREIVQKRCFFRGKRHDNKILKVQILLSRNFVVIAQAPPGARRPPCSKGAFAKGCFLWILTLVLQHPQPCMKSLWWYWFSLLKTMAAMHSPRWHNALKAPFDKSTLDSG